MTLNHQDRAEVEIEQIAFLHYVLVLAPPERY